MRHNFEKVESNLLDQYFEKIVPLLGSSNGPELSYYRAAKSILELSNRYTRHGHDYSDIWLDKDLSEAYLLYYLPLNLLRLQNLLTELHKLDFFTGLRNIHDCGSGPGTLDLALSETSITFANKTFVEKAFQAQKIHQRLLQIFSLSIEKKVWSTNIQQSYGSEDLMVLSYALNEMPEIPESVFDAGAIVIMEPSTRVAGRNLMAFRETLIRRGYHIWAPCTHQTSCPLLNHSTSDWCHVRVHIKQPGFLKKLESHLPIKNQTLTYSYLCARKIPPPQPQGMVRVIGDTLFEKGKIRQAICRGSEREFVSWLKRESDPPLLQRGILWELPKPHLKKGNEIRLSPAPPQSDGDS